MIPDTHLEKVDALRSKIVAKGLVFLVVGSLTVDKELDLSIAYYFHLMKAESKWPPVGLVVSL